jgi:predicted nucleotidyltransferase
MELDSALHADAQSRLRAFKREIENALPGEVVEVRRFGSRARGEAQDDSDYDVAVFLRNNSDRLETIRILSDASYAHILDGFFLNPIGLPADYLNQAGGFRTELAAEISREGILIR